MGTRVFASDTVTVDGRKVLPSARMIYIALHKPKGYISANSDPQGRHLASELFSSSIHDRLFHVGRLDFLSTGLILYTNDGEFARIVSHPRNQIEKEYLVETGRTIPEDFLRLYARGVRVADALYRCKGYEQRGDRSARITLTEGKNRELRTVFASRGIRLKRVHRIRIGTVGLKGIAAGRFRRLTEREVRWFYDHGSGD
jgi:23S rRNA pseudouridine2605 synthase